jgi:hypothetical protein
MAPRLYRSLALPECTPKIFAIFLRRGSAFFRALSHARATLQARQDANEEGRRNDQTAHHREQEMDIFYVAVTVAFFGLSWLLVVLCDRL